MALTKSVDIITLLLPIKLLIEWAGMMHRLNPLI